MNFAESLKNIRKSNNLSQEELAEIMKVSRQSISKYEQGTTYPEIDKLILLSRKFNISIDSLLNGREFNSIVSDNNHGNLEKDNGNSSIQKLLIKSYDGKNLNSYYEFNISPVIKAKEKQPKYIIIGTYKHTFWGKSTNLLGYYATKEDALKEINEIQKALESCETKYELNYYSNVKEKGIGIELDI